MKGRDVKKFIYLLLFVFSAGVVCGQESDIEKWEKLPELPVAFGAGLKAAISLPYKIDNTALKYFRPQFTQHGWSCNQAGSIGYLLTYELNAKRDLAGNINENQYAPLFVWNMLNDGESNHGVSYFDTWEIVKTLGCATYQDFPNWDNAARWMHGYDKYYRAMSNRIYENYSIDVSTAEGIQKLKIWLFNHYDGSTAGGLANFQIGSGGSSSNRLPTGTEEAGHNVTLSFSRYVGHCMTIVGYNDSIRYDVNRDGKFTNNVDINNDGVVDVRDWEIGGVQFVNSYGNRPRAYILYKVLAEFPTSGGIWGNSVHVVRPNAFYEPLLTMKVRMKHNQRNKIKISVGYSTDTTATEPEYIHDFPFYRYDGGSRPMQGDANETIELGLDITSLLSDIEPGKDVKYFLVINEKDNTGTGHGEVINFSVIDYQNGEYEVQSDYKNVEIANNETTLVPVIMMVDYDKVEIETEMMPVALVYEDYSFQMEASGGSPPYIWTMDIDYEEQHHEEPFPVLTNDPVIPGTSGSMAEVNLDFSFPFYGEEFNKLFIRPNGIIAFYQGFSEYPYMIDSELLFKTRKYIKVFGDSININFSQGDNVRFEGDENSATIVWNASVNNQGEIADVNVAVKVFPSGEIWFCYGEIDMNKIPWKNEWIAGFSNGDCSHLKIARVSNSEFLFNDYLIKFLPSQYPEGFEISESGLFSCNPKDPGEIINIKVLVTDSKNMSSSRIVSFSTINWENEAILEQNYPNPFTNSTRIDFKTQKEGSVLIDIYNLAGQKVKTLLDQNLLAGRYSLLWRAYGINELPLETGVYICRLVFGNAVQTRKMFLIK